MNAVRHHGGSHQAAQDQHELARPRPPMFDKLTDDHHQGDHAKLKERHSGDVPIREEPVGQRIRFIDMRVDAEQPVGHYQVGDTDEQKEQDQPLQLAGFNSENMKQTGNRPTCPLFLLFF